MIRCLSHLEIETLLNSDEETPSEIRHHLDSCEVCLSRLQQVILGKKPEFTQSSENAKSFLTPENPPEVPGYDFEKVIGFGGMGFVWKAVQQTPRRTVAVKFIRGKATDTVLLERMKQEADAAARLQHPNVVTLYEFRDDPVAGPFLTMEYVPGGTLADQMQKGPCNPEEACKLIRRLAEAVGFANSRNVIHRDLKPTNILLGEDGTPKISDFGIARLQDTESASKAEIIGTPHYMAPEQARGEAVDGRADVYSLGVILFEMVTGQTPFIGDTVAAVLLAVQRSEPPRAGRLRKGIPSAVETICEKCLQRDPGRRYASAFELAADLDRFLSHRPILAKRTSLSRRFYLFTRRNRAVTATAIAALVILSIVVPYAIVMRSRSKADRQTVTEAKGKIESAESKTISATDKAWSALGLATDESIEVMFARQKQLTPNDKAFLERVIERYDEVAKLTGDTPDIQFRRAIGIYKVAGIRRLLGETSKADQGYRQSLELLERLSEAAPGNKTLSASRAGVRAAHAKLQCAMYLLPEGERNYKAAIEEQQRITEQADIEGNLSIASWWAELAEVYKKTARVQDSIPAYDQALRFVELARSAKPGSANTIRMECRYRLGKENARRILYIADEETESALKAILNQLLQLAATTPDDIDLQLETASAYNELAEFYRFVNRNDDSSSILNRVVQIHEALATQFPSDPEILLSHANAMGSLGSVPMKKDSMAQSLLKAVELHRKLCKEFPKVPEYQVQLCRSHVALAEHLADHPPNAKSPVEKGLIDGMSKSGLGGSIEYITSLNKGVVRPPSRPPYGQIFVVHRVASRMAERLVYGFHQGDVLSKIDVESEFKNAERIAEQVARSYAQNADARQNEAWVIRRRARWEARMISSENGMKFYQRAVEIYRALDSEFQNRAELKAQLSECLAAAATENESTKKEIMRRNREQLLEAVQIADQLLKSSPLNRSHQSLVARTSMAFGYWLLDTQPGESESYLRKALAIREALSKENPNSASLQLDLADTMLALSQNLAAQQLAEESVKFVSSAKSIYESLKSKVFLNQRAIAVSIRDCDVVLLQVALMSQGDHELAVKIMERILSASVHERIDHVLAVCTYASAIRLSAGSTKLSVEQKAAFRKQYIAKVIAYTQLLTKWGVIGSYSLEQFFRELDDVKSDPDYRKVFPPLSKDLLFPKPPIDMERWIR